MRVFIFTLLSLLVTLGAFATQDKKTAELRIQSSTGNLDDATIYFDEGISPAYNAQEDAQMIFSNVPGVPEIFSYTVDKIPCSINGAGALSTTQVVSLGVKINANDIYTISAIQLNNFNPTSIVRLQDKKLDSLIDLRENFYRVELDTMDSMAGRFNLLVSYPIQYSSLPSNCANNGGIISLTTDSTIVWNFCQLYNKDSGTVFATDTNVNGMQSFTDLPSGNYTLNFTFNEYMTSQNFHLNGNYIIASIGVPQQTIYTLQDVIFNGISTNANHYAWSFGDGTLIDGVANPDQTYYTPGTYTVYFTCSNDSGCTDSAKATVTVLLATGINNTTAKDISITTIGSNVMVNMNDAPANNALLHIYNLLGQAVYTEPITLQNEVVNLDDQTPGYYIVSVVNAGRENTKRVFIPK